MTTPTTALKIARRIASNARACVARRIGLDTYAQRNVMAWAEAQRLGIADDVRIALRLLNDAPA